MPSALKCTSHIPNPSLLSNYQCWLAHKSGRDAALANICAAVLNITLFCKRFGIVQVMADLGKFGVADFKSAFRFSLSRHMFQILSAGVVLHAA